MMLGTFIKQPVERSDYDISYAEWLVDGDSVESVVVTSFPEDSLVIDGIQAISPIIKMWIEGGLNGVTYKVTLTVTTVDGRIKQDEFKLKVKDI